MTRRADDAARAAVPELDVIPEPWEYNPSAWSQRVPVALVALVGFLLAAYMGLYQMGLVRHVWDPVFGDQTRAVLDPLEPKWEYPRSRVDTEELIRREHGDIPAVLLRIAGAYTDTCDSIPIAQQIQRIHARTLTSHVYPGDTSHGQAFVHLDDLVDAIEHTVERRDHLPRDVVPILIGEPDTYSYGDLQRQIGRLLHDEPDRDTERTPAAVAKAGAWVQDKVPGIEEPFIKPWMIDLADDHYELDIGRARELLGWEPDHRLMDTLPRMIAALRRDPQAWYRRHELEVPDEVAEPA